MCGIVAVLTAPGEQAVGMLYEALLALQHRGQDAAGIITLSQSGRLCLHKDNGMARDVFQPEQLRNLRGPMGIGHVRYPTAGSSSCAEAQPFFVNSPYGIALAHNGNLVGLPKLKHDLLWQYRHLNTGSDSEVLLNLLATELLSSLPANPTKHQEEPESANGPFAAMQIKRSVDVNGDEGPSSQLTNEKVIDAVKAVMSRCHGGYAVVSMIVGYGILAFRDPNGIRPLSYGRRQVTPTPAEEVAKIAPDVQKATGFPPSPVRTKVTGPPEYEYMVASESGVLTSTGFELIGDVPPGHALLLRRGAPPELFNCALAPAPHCPCVFEYVYFARPDSILDGVSVYRSRLKMGEKLALRMKEAWPDHDIDVVIPVPDTARTAALECATHLGIVYREGFMKNRYVGRTFIMPAQGLRKKSVRQKLSPIISEFAGRNVLLVDDSIVRGTTSKQIVQMAREAGAKRVYMASAAPPVRFPNVYGIDMPTKEELIASRVKDISEVAMEIGADKVFYQELQDLKDAIIEAGIDQGVTLSGMDCSCFDGLYVTQEVGDEYLSSLAATRTANRGSEASNAVHQLYRLDGHQTERAKS